MNEHPLEHRAPVYFVKCCWNDEDPDGEPFPGQTACHRQAEHRLASVDIEAASDGRTLGREIFVCAPDVPKALARYDDLAVQHR